MRIEPKLLDHLPSASAAAPMIPIRNTLRPGNGRAAFGAPTAAGARAPTVVIVDDALNSRLLLAQLVRGISSSLLIESFEHPEAALVYARTSPTDLLLVDHYLPGCTGTEMVRRFRQIPNCADVPVVMVTADADRTLRYEALNAGANDFLLKPFDEYETMARCRNLLQLRRHQIMVSDRALLLQDRVTRAVADVHDRELETLAALARAAAQRDTGAGKHLERMACICGFVARGMKLADDVAFEIEVAAPLHDIGKLGIHDAILLKPGRLTDAEMAIMRTHAMLGYDILKVGRSKYLKTGAIIALHHHERVDGSGYPHGLTGNAIPLMARIAAVADVFDALVSPRAYKQAWSIERAVEHLRAESGRQFDGECVAGFSAQLDRILRTLRSFAPPA